MGNLNEPEGNIHLYDLGKVVLTSADAKLLEEAVIPLAKTLIKNNPRSGNFSALVSVFLGRTKELKISTECQDQLFIWQAHNALFLLRCLLKVFIREMSEEELHLQFTYHTRAPGSCDTSSEDLMEELICNLVHLVVEVPLLDITYNILFEAVTTLLVLLSYQLFHKDILREGRIYRCLTRGRCLSLTSRLVKTLLYNFVRQEKCPPPSAHVFQAQADGGGLLYGLASGVASRADKLNEESSRPPAHAFPIPVLCPKPLAKRNSPLPVPDPILFPTPVAFGPPSAYEKFPSSRFGLGGTSLYTALCEQQRSDQVTLLLYTLLHQNPNMKTYMLSRTDMENLVMPILEILYHVEERNSHHVYMALIILLILTEDDTFNRSIHEVGGCWSTVRFCSMECETKHAIVSFDRVREVVGGCERGSQRVLKSGPGGRSVCKSGLFALLSKKHNKVLERATQSLQRTLGADGTALPDYAQDLSVIEEVIRMLLEIINSCLSNSLHHNPNLVYALLYKRELFEQFRSHPSFQDIMQNLDTVIGFFSQRLEQAGSDLSVERVQEVIKKGAVALPKDRLRKFPELKFKYVEEEQPEDFFIPTRRSGLVRRLWRSRAPVDCDGEEAADTGTHGAGGSGRGNGSLCMGKATKAAAGKAGGGGVSGGASAEAELKALTHSVLKKIKEKQLEVLLQAVESKGGARSPCLLLPGRMDVYSLPLLLFKVFRWPDLRHWSQLKRLPCCESYGKINPELVCCNPHHMSRLCEPESPPPPYSRYPVDLLKSPDSPDSPPASTETGETIHSAPVGFSAKRIRHVYERRQEVERSKEEGKGVKERHEKRDSQGLQECGEREHWCVVAYWEEKARVGRLYSVRDPSLDIFYDLPQGTGFCLGQLGSESRSALVHIVRPKIGYGIQLSREADGVWVYNRSRYPIFIKSATLDDPSSRTLLVHKVFPGFSIKAFDYEKARSLQRPNDHEFSHQPHAGFTVQISFVKGWGQCYTRQFISSCPCWLELIFNNR
ncbi:Dymeclin [Bagarius yarrelli]|uniref:Dymeclin n=1 Tax=Bagarius yarrelli TaxID=175774 RepID=A0A556TUJ9_BAGYA|nr:Dymeclin [Bagarius yarrelli]